MVRTHKTDSSVIEDENKPLTDAEIKALRLAGETFETLSIPFPKLEMGPDTQ